MDADLAAGIEPSELPVASERSLARVIEFRAGPWAPPTQPGSDAVGLFVLDGLLAHRLVAHDRQSVDLLGPGDVLTAGEWADGFGAVPTSTRWDALSAGELAVLDRYWHERLTPWPVIHVALLDRTAQRSRSMALRLALARIPMISQRLRLLLWHLADRWGRVGPDGVVLPLRLPHETLAELACARRESVCRAMQELARYDLVTARPDGGWLLRGSSPAEIEMLRL